VFAAQLKAHVAPSSQVTPVKPLCQPLAVNSQVLPAAQVMSETLAAPVSVTVVTQTLPAAHWIEPVVLVFDPEYDSSQRPPEAHSIWRLLVRCIPKA